MKVNSGDGWKSMTHVVTSDLQTITSAQLNSTQLLKQIRIRTALNKQCVLGDYFGCTKNGESGEVLFFVQKRDLAVSDI